jgi:hypothetical protein
MWKEVLNRVGVDAVATVVYLYFDELARVYRACADDYGDPQLIMNELTRDGTVDGDILNSAESRAWARFRQEYWHLPEPNWEEVSDLIWSLGC